MSLTVEQYKGVFVNTSHLLRPEQFDQAVKSAKDSQRPLDQVLMERALIAPHQFLQLLSSYFGVASTELKVSDVDTEVLKLIPEAMAAKDLVIAYGKGPNGVKVAAVDPSNEASLHDIASVVRGPIEVFVTSEHAIERALVLYGGDLHKNIRDAVAQLETDKVNEISAVSDSSPIVQLVDAMIDAAVLMEASDVHIEPFETEVIIRFRIDGLLRTVETIPNTYHGALTARIKVLSGLKVDQKRLPQDGRFAVTIKGQEVNVRVSTVPSLWGEKIVMRILPKEAHLFDMTNLGFLDSDLRRIKSHLKRPHGLILVCGPTGSGKTTTLYAFLQEIGTDRIDVVNMSTIEDPIEYTIPRITQIQTQPDIELTFAAGLKALLRQDPDIIMVGEIRDSETADFAIRAALVGRLLLSSLHTNDAPGAVPRLLDMGLEPYLVSSTLSLIVAQRLVRKLCTYCRQSYNLDPETLANLKQNHGLDQALATLARIGIIESPTKTDLRFYKPVGCPRCDNSGYRGRTALFEIIEVSDELKKAINAHQDTGVIRKVAIQQGMKTMFEDGIAKMLLGVIDLNELLRAAYS